MRRFLQREDINFLLTNRVPRALLTRLMGWFSRIENPWLCALSLRLWQLFTDLDLSDARATRFRSLHACFTRELRDGARPIDPDPEMVLSPCDAIVGARGRIDKGMLIQAKDSRYALEELLTDEALARDMEGGTFVTLRLTSSMYHRFHAPDDCRVEKITYVSGDVWNVNPPALRRVPGLFCKNERAILRCRMERDGTTLLLVPVAAILVASIRLHCCDVRLHLRYRGPNVIACDAAYARGQEMGWFEHGSTIIVIVPRGYVLHESLGEGLTIRVGQALLRRARD
jgi:phosphatidylserine decarboxylase